MTDKNVELKARLLDAQDALQSERETIHKFIQNLVNVMQVSGDAQGSVTLEMITARAEELASREAVPVDEVPEDVAGE